MLDGPPSMQGDNCNGSLIRPTNQLAHERNGFFGREVSENRTRPNQIIPAGSLQSVDVDTAVPCLRVKMIRAETNIFQAKIGSGDLGIWKCGS